MSRESKLHGQSVLITGASEGIGRATALELASRGAKVAMAARTESKLAALADEIEREHGTETLVVPTDVTEEAQVQSMVADTVEAFGGLDVVVSNAGISHEEYLEDVTMEEFERVQTINLRGTFLTARESMPHLRESQGNIIFLGSLAGKFPSPKFPVYAASKSWIRGFALSIAGDVGRDGVGTTVVAPTSVRTDIGAESRGQSLKEKYAEGEVPEPEDLARAIAFAAEQESPNTVSELDFFTRSQFSHVLDV